MANCSEKQINYVEIPARDLTAAKKFFGDVFGWTFVDYGDEYVAFNDSQLDGGFYQSDKASTVENGSTLVVFYSATLEAAEEKVVANGGKIVRETLSFPGGRRFHFADPNGNEFAIWSDKGC